MPEVEIADVSKRFKEGEGAALSNVSLSVEKGELVVVVGPSGCGKSTTLRIVAGLEDADSGDVRIGGKSMRGVAPQDRDVAMVFQGYALYPTMTVRENIEFPLKMRRMPATERRARADEAADMLRLGKLMDRLPLELSGGERQRVAMGRAIVRRPRVFLFDEPLSNLDAALRQDLRVEIGVLVRKLGATAIYVTHDQVEAMTLADRICVIDKGEVQEVSSPKDIYERPGSSFVGTFLGAPRMNLLDAVVDGDVVVAGPFRLSGAQSLPKAVKVGVRPENVVLHDSGQGTSFEVILSEPLGSETHYVLREGNTELRVRASGFRPLPAGAKVNVTLEAAHLHWFDPAQGGRRIG